MALEQFYFSVIGTADFAEASTTMNLIGRHLKTRLREHEYGPGVAWIIVFVSLLEATNPPRRGRHTYESGKRTVETEGIEYDIENALKIFITPDTDRIRSAASVADVTEAVKMAFLHERQDLLALNVQDFDMPLFFSDVVIELDTIAKSPALWPLLAGGTRFASGAPDGLARSRVSVADFPAAVLAFVEQELPTVNEAARRKDRKSLMPLINRMNEFLEPWAHMMGPKGLVFETFPACASLVVDLGREIAIECDDQLSEAERQRLHLEFRERLAVCRECANRISLE